MEFFFAKADALLNIISNHSPLWIYLFVFGAMVFENFFPPFPGDTVVFVCGVYAAGGHSSWTLIYVLSILGTMTSVMTLYYLGYSKGRAIFQSERTKWLGIKRLDKVEKWFARWGENVLLWSRWLPGFRSLLALFAGVGRVRPGKMILYSLLSTMTWNLAVLFLAYRLRRDWQQIDSVLKIYGSVILIIISLVALALLIRHFHNKRRKSQP